jgi:hypothetical protein
MSLDELDDGGAKSVCDVPVLPLDNRCIGALTLDDLAALPKIGLLGRVAHALPLLLNTGTSCSTIAGNSIRRIPVSCLR